ncbi:MAG: SDR family oxidoreductase [Candidatus Lindowbacteria bacterium]|nr:SDR family oxidoreductase [Candidatus Lindowbacteria bacterium]
MRQLSELMNLENRIAFVTGAAGYLGLSICETLMELGAHVIVSDRRAKDCKARCAELASKGFRGTAEPLAFDLSKRAVAKVKLKGLLKTHKRIDIVIHAAALVGTSKLKGWATDLANQSPETWDKAIDLNLTSAFVLSQQLLPALKKSKNASIIFIGSTYGVHAPVPALYKGTKMNLPAAYAVSKAALIQFGKYLSTVMAPGIRVNSISPGGIYRGQPEAFHKRYIERTPLGRMATEEDFKGAIAYLASDMSRYTTGTNLMVDGGWSAW